MGRRDTESRRSKNIGSMDGSVQISKGDETCGEGLRRTRKSTSVTVKKFNTANPN